jgi:3-methyladenine DNA glycosylase/8-oxoguanine DNA glycosylase
VIHDHRDFARGYLLISVPAKAGRKQRDPGRIGQTQRMPDLPASASPTSASPASGQPRSARPARSYQAAAAILAERDPVLRRLVAEAGPARVRPPDEAHFAALVRAILYQQLAGAAAAAIHGRLITALGGEVTPERLLALPASTLRAAGLSARKAASLQDLAAKVTDGTVLLDPDALRSKATPRSSPGSPPSWASADGPRRWS